jgi:AraC-like DNA-binding protein
MKEKKFSQAVVDYILNCNLERLRDVTVDGISAHFGVTKMTLISKFRNQMGITPGKFILREKFHRALVLMIKSPALTIEEIREKLGFSSSDYFIRVFRTFFGTSPGRYRDTVKTNIKIGSNSVLTLKEGKNQNTPVNVFHDPRRTGNRDSEGDDTKNVRQSLKK